MVSTFTPNKSLEKPGAGDYAGTWDSPVNSDWSIIDLALGTIQSISLAAGSITLSTAQARSPFLTFTGALPSNVTVTIPGLSSAPGTTISGGFYTIQNQTTNSSVRTVTIATTVAGQQQIAIPPWEPTDILVEGTNSSQAGSVKFRNLGRVGSYWDYAGSSVPNWVSACTVPPYLYCNGASFSSATYPALATVLNGTTLPDSRGRYRATINDGTSRLTSNGAGSIDGNTNFAGGGAQTIAQGNLPNVTLNTTIAAGQGSHTHALANGSNILTQAAGGAQGGAGAGGVSSIALATLPAMSGTTPLGGSGINYVPPSYVGGITMIRAA